MAKAQFSLANYRQKADEEFGTFDIGVDEDTVVQLKNPLRVDAKNQERLFEIVDELKFEGEEATSKDVARMTPLMIEIMTLVGDENVSMLTDQIKDDTALIMAIFQDYFKAVGLGEASSSES